MTERYGYGYGDEPSGQGPVSGRGAVTERQAGQEAGDQEQADERVLDLSDERAAAEERTAEARDQEEEPPQPPPERAEAAPSSSTSIFEAAPADAAALEGSGEPGTGAPVDQEVEAPSTEEPAEPDAAATVDQGEQAAPPAAEQAAPPAAEPVGPTVLLASIDAGDVRARFLDIQAGFVDEPRQAVEQAGRFVDDLVQQVIDALQANRGQLRDTVAEGSTEDLRLALRGYRQFVDRLLGLTL
jgi:hypothetical protein